MFSFLLSLKLFPRETLLFVSLQYLGGISPTVPIKMYPSGLLSWLSPFFVWRNHFSLISAFQMPSTVPGTIEGAKIKATQWIADGRKPCIKIRLISGTTWWVYTKQFEFLKNMWLIEVNDLIKNYYVFL